MSQNSNTAWYVYIIETETGRYYTGISTDPERRFFEHLLYPQGAKFFRSDPPEKIIYWETFPNRSQASQRECEIKKFSKQRKRLLIEQRVV